MKFRKKPVVIEAWQMPISKDLFDEIKQKTDREMLINYCTLKNGDEIRDITSLGMSTLEGVMKAENDDWIILGVENEVYPCKNSVFQATYEKV
nr:hypothetical protein [Methanobrevibacter arboriphilus]